METTNFNDRHIVNLTNPMMIKGPFRELLPVSVQVSIRIPDGSNADKVHLLVRGESPSYNIAKNKIMLEIPEIYDHEIIGINLTKAST